MNHRMADSRYNRSSILNPKTPRPKPPKTPSEKDLVWKRTVDQLRDQLAKGATIQAIDRFGPILHLNKDGVVIGGLKFYYPPADSAAP